MCGRSVVYQMKPIEAIGASIRKKKNNTTTKTTMTMMMTMHVSVTLTSHAVNDHKHSDGKTSAATTAIC